MAPFFLPVTVMVRRLRLLAARVKVRIRSMCPMCVEQMCVRYQ